MISNIFKKPDSNALLEELKRSNLKENKVDSIIQHLEINQMNQDLQNFLHLIIPENKIESLKWLLKNGINYNAQDMDGITPLMLACKHGLTDAVEELLKAGADTNLENHHGYTAIEFAIYNDYYSIYKKIKPYVKDINKKNKKSHTLLHIAIKSFSKRVVSDLFKDKNFKHKKDVLFFKNSFLNNDILNIILDNNEVLNEKDDKGRNILFYVIENGIKSEDIFNSLIEEGLDVNCVDIDGNNILLHLIELIAKKEEHLSLETLEEREENKLIIKNLINMIPVILENEIDTKISNIENETVLSIPTKNKNIEVLKTLFEYEVDINILDKNKRSAFDLIITKGTDYLEVIYILLDYGINPNIKNDEGKTVIEKIINASLIIREEKKAKNLEKRDLDFEADYISVLEGLLINTDSKLTQLNSKDEPYFFEALRYGAIDIVKLLIKHGADINEADKDGNNIIYKYMDENKTFKKESKQKDYYNNLQAIIMMGANVNAKDSFGGITLHKAILNCDVTIIKMLLHSGADMNAIDNRGRHILHNTIWNNNNKIFRLIYSYNKSLLNEPDKFGVMPINYAAFLGYTDLVLDFIEKNAHINNPYRKTKYILNFLKKFHKNLKPLIEKARTKVEKEKLKMLVENMEKEFDVKY